MEHRLTSKALQGRAVRSRSGFPSLLARVGPTPRKRFSMIKVLVVEDDPAILRAITDNLRFDGYEVVTAHDGEAGERLHRTHKPDLMILDLMMPRLGGLELCRRLRAEGAATPILMLTAKSEEADRIA